MTESQRREVSLRIIQKPSSDPLSANVRANAEVAQFTDAVAHFPTVKAIRYDEDRVTKYLSIKPRHDHRAVCLLQPDGVVAATSLPRPNVGTGWSARQCRLDCAVVLVKSQIQTLDIVERLGSLYSHLDGVDLEHAYSVAHIPLGCETTREGLNVPQAAAT